MFGRKDPPGFYMETIHKEYKEVDPVFFDTSQFGWCAELEKMTPQLLQELKPLMAEDYDGLATNPEVRLQFPPRIWKSFTFYFNGFKSPGRIRTCPALSAELAKIPNLISAAISVLEPNSFLIPHNGGTNGVMRYHLGLNIPASMPDCGMVIGDHEVSWQVGKSFMFCDMVVHSAHNRTAKRRHILMLDVVRPEFTSVKKKICVYNMAQFFTDVVANFSRKALGVNSAVKSQGPDEELKYEANKLYALKGKEKVSFSVRALRAGEQITMKFFVGLMYVIFFFKKVQ